MGEAWRQNNMAQNPNGVTDQSVSHLTIYINPDINAGTAKRPYRGSQLHNSVSVKWKDLAPTPGPPTLYRYLKNIYAVAIKNPHLQLLCKVTH